MPLPKSTPGRRILALTLKYAYRYPEIQQGQKIQGRMTLGKRAEHRIQITNILVRDRKIAEIVNNTQLEINKQIQQIKQYVLERFKDPQKAKEYLSEVQASVEKIISKGEKKYLKRIAQRRHLSPEEEKKFYSELSHAISSQISTIGALLELTKMRL